MNDALATLSGALMASSRLIWLVPVLPLLAAAAIGLRRLLRRGGGDAQEPRTAGLASGASLGALLLLLVIDTAALAGLSPTSVVAGEWLWIGAVPVRLSFVVDAWSLPMATLVALIAWIALRHCGFDGFAMTAIASVVVTAWPGPSAYGPP